METRLATPHIVCDKNDIAPSVLMPGDPLRAKYIAENLLENAKLFNEVRGIYGYTGEYRGKRVSVMASGMGMPSMGIYSYELFHFADVRRIIRIGSAGGIHPDLRLRDIVVAMSASTNSNYMLQYGLPGAYAPTASYPLLRDAVAEGEKRGARMMVGNILSSDTFYDDDADSLKAWRKMGVLAVEMEAAALYCNAARAGKEALCLATISDLPLTGDSCTAMERQTTFQTMMEIALSIA